MASLDIITFLLPCAFFVLIAILSTIIFNRKKPNYERSPNLPPGEMGLPWIGETMDFYNSQRKNRLYEDFVQPRVAKYGKTFKTKLMGSPTVIVNGAEANRFFLLNEFKLVISSWPTSSVQLMGKDSIMEKQGEQHRKLRGLIASSLNHAGLETLVPKMCDATKSHLETKWSDVNEVSLYRSTKTLTLTIVFECLLGIKVEGMMSECFERVLEGVFAPPIRVPGSKFSRAKKAREEIGALFVRVIREKKNEFMEELGFDEVGDDRNGETLLRRFVVGIMHGEITEEEAVDNMVLLVFAAHDTTSFAIAMTFKMLARNPSCYDKLLREHVHVMSNKKQEENLSLEDMKKMKYTWKVARESMRLFPPIFGSFRKAVADIEYEGYMIPKGWKVLWTTYGTHYNPQYFQDPLSFDPERFDESISSYTFLPFGGGPRVCAGYQLAKMNILIFIHFVVTRYDWSLVYPDEEIRVDPLPFPSNAMPIKISPKMM